MNNYKSTRHVHADLIIAWAEGAKIQYYDKNQEKWKTLTTPDWSPSTDYRVAPLVCKCNGVVIPTPESEKLIVGTVYYSVALARKDLVEELVWANGILDNLLLEGKLVHLTYEAAKAHAEAIMKLEYCYGE